MITGPITGLTGPQWLDIQSRTTYELTNDPLPTGAETLTFNGHLPGQTSWHIRINPFHSTVQGAMGLYGPYRGIEYIVMHEMGHATPAAVEFFRDYDHLPQAQLAPLLELFADASADSMFEMYPTDYGQTVSSGYTPGWTAKGTPSDDLIAGVLGPSFIWGSAGIDTVTFSQLGAGINADLSLITAGAARLNVYLSVENLTGTAYNDTFYGSEGDNSLSGGGGSDVISGNEGNDYISGGDGNDYLLGNGGFDTILGNTGNDTLLGGRDGDVVRGGQGDDLIIGDNATDYLFGDMGSDTLTGHLGADYFYTNAASGVDIVTDFNQAQGDQVRLEYGEAYTAYQSGADTVVDLFNGTKLILQNTTFSALAPGWIA